MPLFPGHGNLEIGSCEANAAVAVEVWLDDLECPRVFRRVSLKLAFVPARSTLLSTTPNTTST